MKHYFIEYDTEYGSATFEGEYSDYDTFIAEANKLAHESGILDSDESVLDCDYQVIIDGQESFLITSEGDNV